MIRAVVERLEAAESPDELRHALKDLGKALRALGAERMADLGEDVSEEARHMEEEGRRVLRQVESSLGRLEKKAEKNAREHPGMWLTGLLGVVGFGLVLGLVLGRRDA